MMRSSIVYLSRLQAVLKFILKNVMSQCMFTEVCRRNTLALAQAYKLATGKSLTTISMRYYGNGTFFRELENRRRSISVERLGDMLTDFALNWPADVPWPELEPLYFSQGNLLQQRYASANRLKAPHGKKK